MLSLKFVIIFNVVLFHWTFAKIFKCADMEHISLTPDKELNNFAYGSPFCVILYRSYKLLKKQSVFGPLCIYAVNSILTPQQLHSMTICCLRCKAQTLCSVLSYGRFTSSLTPS